MKFEEEIEIRAGTRERYEELLNIDDFSEISDEDREIIGIKEDDHPDSWSVKFDNGTILLIDLYSGQTNYYLSTMLINKDDTRSFTPECSFDMDDIEIEWLGDTYIVKWRNI